MKSQSAGGWLFCHLNLSDKAWNSPLILYPSPIHPLSQCFMAQVTDIRDQCLRSECGMRCESTWWERKWKDDRPLILAYRPLLDLRFMRRRELVLFRGYLIRAYGIPHTLIVPFVETAIKLFPSSEKYNSWNPFLFGYLPFTSPICSPVSES